MIIAVRQMRPEDAKAYLEVHRAAIRGLASRDYPPAVIEAWAPLPVTNDAIEQLLLNTDGEYRLLAEIDGEAIGIGALVARKAELRACYVAPEASRKGVGSRLLREIERIARQGGLEFLRLDSSVTAEPFYRAHGYKVVGRQDHVLRTGHPMASVQMHKSPI